ncbi:MAG: Asp-tRNA(Asn)/Glu-tRNA(Gln) amidotransferase subunit GatA [Cryobacterium sp.]|nr:Asp-tRNA(Asn)/Glu-tRNA(Gln) amidotransferase subunit GatA [Oligoflexia bacterium]
MLNEKYFTISEIHDAYDRKEFTPTELTLDTLKAVKASQHNAYLSTLEDRAMAAAKSAEKIIAEHGKVPREKFPLLGIPLAIKDNLVIDGVRTTCASKMLENYVSPYTGTAVERLEKAGAVFIGKANMDEFAMGGSNENSAFGLVDHPTHPGYVPGGSSGGSATAVRARLCVAALGSDTGGSVRQPASYCGVVGLKPSYGLVSRYGLVAFASSLDQIGPLTNSVADAAILLGAMGGHDPKDSTSSPYALPDFTAELRKPMDWKGLRVGIPKEYFVDGFDPAVLSEVRAAIAWVEKQGAKLVDISLPNTPYAVSVYYIVAVSEASSNLARFDGVRFGVRPPDAMQVEDIADFFKRVRSNFGPEVKRRIILGTFALSSGYYDAYYRKACQVRRMIKDDFDRVFRECDVILGPVSPSTAFKHGEKNADPLKMYLNDILTIPCNLAGLPGMSVPCGTDNLGLPIGLQVIAPMFRDDLVLKVGHAFEKGYPTADRDQVKGKEV